MVYLVFRKILRVLWQNNHAAGQNFIVVTGQKLKKSCHLVALSAAKQYVKKVPIRHSTASECFLSLRTC